MKRVVRFEVKRKGFRRGNSEGVHLALELAKRIELPVAGQTFGRQTRRRAFKRASNFDRVPHIVQGKSSNNESTCRIGLEQALVGQPLESKPDRCPRNTEQRNQWQLRNPLASLKLPFQNHLAQPDNSLAYIR